MRVRACVYVSGVRVYDCAVWCTYECNGKCDIIIVNNEGDDDNFGE